MIEIIQFWDYHRSVIISWLLMLCLKCAYLVILSVECNVDRVSCWGAAACCQGSSPRTAWGSPRTARTGTGGRPPGGGCHPSAASPPGSPPAPPRCPASSSQYNPGINPGEKSFKGRSSQRLVITEKAPKVLVPSPNLCVDPRLKL